MSLQCSKCYKRKWRKLHPEKVREQNNENYAKHSKERRMYQQNYVKNNPEKAKEIQMKSILKHRIQINEKKKERIGFKGKQIAVGYNPRLGVCSNCNKSVKKGEIKITHMHHTQYDENNPLNHTVELCVACHNRTHKKINIDVKLC